MTKNWTGNILSKSFEEQTNTTETIERQKKILAATKPVAKFFESIGFKQAATSSESVATVFVANNVLRLNAEQTPPARHKLGYFDGIVIDLSLNGGKASEQKHPLSIRVSLNEHDQGHYQLLNGEAPIMSSGDPRRIISAFVQQTEEPFAAPLASIVNRHYKTVRDGLLKPVFN